jgi:hypothetical protein
VLVGPQVVIIPPLIFITQKYALLCPWEAATHPYAESHKSNPTPRIPYVKVLKYYTPIYKCVFQVVSFPTTFLPEPSMHFPSPHTYHIPCTSHYSWCNNPNHWLVQITKHHIMQFLLHTAKQRLPLLVNQFVDDGRNAFVLLVEERTSLYLLRS